MFSLCSIASFFIHQFTFYIDGGIGEAALIGAAFGGAKAIATGQDPLEAALLGGVTGGAMSGIGSVFSEGANNLAAVKTGDFVDAAGNSFTPLAENTFNPAAFNTATAAPTVAQEATQAVNNGIAAPDFTPITGTPYTGNLTTDTSFLSPNNTGEVTNLAGANPKSFADTVKATETAQGISQDPNVSASNPFQRFKNYVNPTAGGTADKYLTMAANNPEIAAGIAGYGYGALTQKPPTVAEVPKEKSKLAGYDPEHFTAYEPAIPNPYYSAHYAAEGGTMRSYAEGGIAALAQGGMDSPGISPLGMGSNQAYPGGRLDTTQFATPTQMPTSSAVINSDYEMRTNPYTGEPGPGMAEGGVVRYAYGGSAGDMSYFNGNPMFGVQTGQQSSGIGSKFGDAVPTATDSGNLGANFQASQATPNVYKPTQADQTPSYNPNPAQSAAATVASPAYDAMMEGVAPQDFNRVFSQITGQTPYAPPPKTEEVVKKVQGGIAGYSLGGYAAGGNPRLLKGPGDGMSDNIPAVIGNKQPARLADGEFVVPADVVSHLGNGSTDAGAKHLYAMMDKVRTARTGNKKQGKQIKPEKYLPR